VLVIDASLVVEWCVAPGAPDLPELLHDTAADVVRGTLSTA
jgi:hypothetical protein